MKNDPPEIGGELHHTVQRERGAYREHPGGQSHEDQREEIERVYAEHDGMALTAADVVSITDASQAKRT